MNIHVQVYTDKYFQFLVVNRISMNIYIQVFVRTCYNSLVSIPKNSRAESRGRGMFNFVKNLSNCLWSDYTILNPHQHLIRVPVPHPHWHLGGKVILIHSHGSIMLSHFRPICVSLLNNNVEYLFIYLLSNHIYSFMLIFIGVFYYWVVKILHILQTQDFCPM